MASLDDMDAPPRPWQFDWKRPRWQSSSPTPTPLLETDADADKHSNKVKGQGKEGIAMDHTAAAVLSSEVASLLDPGSDETSSSLVLTVTLLSTKAASDDSTVHASNKHQQQHHKHKGDVASADIVLVEVIRQSAAGTGTGDDSWFPHTNIDATTTTTAASTAATASETTTSSAPAAAVATGERNMECLRSRRLRWPQSALEGGSEPSESEHNPFLNFSFYKRQRETTKTDSVPAVGLVSVSLCRLPPATPTVTVMQDALDVVHLLSLGMTSGLTVSQTEWLRYLQTQSQTQSQSQSQSQPPSSGSTNDSEDTDTDTDTATAGTNSPLTDLVLACLTSDGHVHLYSPWDLLGMAKSASTTATTGGTVGTIGAAANSTQSQNSSSNNNDMDTAASGSGSGSVDTSDLLEQGMASLMLGDSLLTSIQESILPLSQPMHSIAVSVPWWHRNTPSLRKQKTKQGTNIQSRGLAARADEHEHEHDDNDIVDEDDDKVETGSVLWDPSAWDSTIDSATSQYRTKDNVPVACVAAWDYLCVAGRGRRIHGGRRRRQRLGKRTVAAATITTASTPPHSPPSMASQTTPSWLSPSKDSQQHDPEVGDQPSVVSSLDETDAATAATSPSVQGSVASNLLYRARHHEGGFVTFISLRNYSQARTIYLPFAPKTISPFVWGGMSFLLVIGDTVAAAIRTDASDNSTVIDGKAPSPFASSEEYENETDGSGQGVPGSKEKKTMIRIRRFQVLPIRFPELSDDSNQTIVGSGMATSPPGLASLFSSEHETQVVRHSLHAVNLISTDEAVPLFADYSPNMEQDSLAVISTEYQQTARIPTLSPDALSHLGLTWCHLDQGWCLLGTANFVYFICWEGALTGRGPFVIEVAEEETHECIHALVSAVMPVNPFASGTRMAYQDFKLPFTEPYEKPAAFRLVDERKESDVSDVSEELDDIVVEALESISSLTYRENVTKQSSPLSPRRRSSAYTNQEKSVRLLRQCSSWTQLEQSHQTRSHFELQEPAVSVRLGFDASVHFLLSLRRIVLENGEATPFHQVLSWLSDQQDYFTAASLALDLLRDADSLRHLWRAFEKIDVEDERSKLEGLLDGIIPIYGENDRAPLQSTLTQLADMTVGCLTKGGHAMSSTLEHFVKRNPNYDAARACLMLVATTACAVSDDEETVASVMGKNYIKNANHDSSILWPVRCLLQVGVARDNLFTALLLLNVTIPDELRRRRRSGVATTSIPSMGMCKSLVSLIVASSPHAADLLLGIVDEQSRQPFWQSLQHDARLELSLISIDGKSPMLRQPEVRSWALEELHKCMEAEGSASSVNVFETMPTEWLKELSMACLTNAGCYLDTILRTTLKDSSEETPDSDGLIQHIEELQTVRNALVPAPCSGGLDFDLLIPALLILGSRNVLWREPSDVSTQSMLNAACYLAGRRNIEEPLFVLNSSTLMLQCTLCGNVPAGANFVGGKDGLTLECCDILMNQVDMEIEEAEAFLLSDPMPTNTNIIATIAEKIAKKGFAIEYAHRHILWLLEEHVLRIRTYGEFDTTHMRGNVDPIFAATVCLRTWWRVTRHDLDSGTAWLVRWLRQQLCIDETGVSEISPQRLVCAALVRALVWPSNSSNTKSGKGTATSTSTPVLATLLRVPSHFLIQLAQSCCGLVEAIPAAVAEEAWKLVESSRSANNSASMNSINMDAVMAPGPAEPTVAIPERPGLPRNDSISSIVSKLST